ncbi:four-helix bundle copper-binding protein [Rossellomorea vietnamensis]|uniref:Four-helix bundle copper-binding protein n=1 Tax=Rossellomorea vietnamensis TaxID=218284 RepID=A0A5D4MES6_9BACI|nr:MULTISPECIES: four-helix bundle copper-binding protein [Bacillaceae]TYS00365.1 four-helix bundle copper-binding protein [Rossellomorea vietnamensis]
MQQTYEECIKACQECLEACNVCFDSCLNEENVGMMAGCIRLDRECAAVCSLAVNSMQSGSPNVKEILKLLVKVCESCGNECNKHEHDHCRKCAAACFTCGEECKKLIA